MLPSRITRFKSASYATTSVPQGKKGVGSRGREYSTLPKDENKEIPIPGKKEKDSSKGYDRTIEMKSLKQHKILHKKSLKKQSLSGKDRESIDAKIGIKVGEETKLLKDTLEANIIDIVAIKSQLRELQEKQAKSDLEKNRTADTIEKFEGHIQSANDKKAADPAFEELKTLIEENLAAVSKVAVEKIFSSPTFLIEALNKFGELIKNKEDLKKLKEAFKAVYEDPEIKNDIIDFCSGGAEESQIIRDGLLKSILNKILNKINIFTKRPAQVELPATFIAGAILAAFVATCATLNYLYNIYTMEGATEDHVVEFEDIYKNFDIKKQTVPIPQELKEIIKESHQIDQQIKEHEKALLGMSGPTKGIKQYVQEVNPYSGSSEWVDSGLKYYNDRKNSEYLKKVDAHIENKDGFYTMAKESVEIMLETGRLHTDYGKAFLGILAEESRLRAATGQLEVKSEEYQTKLMATHAELHKQAINKLKDKTDSNAIADDKSAAAYQNKLNEFKVERPNDFLEIHKMNIGLQDMIDELDQMKPKPGIFERIFGY